MTTTRKTILATAALLLAAPIITAGALTTSAVAQSYPRVTGTGENMMVDYGPMGQGTLVGGGRVMVSDPTGMDVRVVHFDAVFAQAPRPGYVPLTIGSGESQQTVYVPEAMVDMMRRARGSQR
ncbi:hypothetical protein HB662_17445 [Roseomonas frigidaquae]|uniref:Uncharacterized protein n=1 Tax=Falsiroseomonas frigidaquae TaxID=487318 RepID=A0ABX1F2L0_9PROT|nr:hypothetical protein [Falsiroseomonas frigidaquae]NKE46570.1 hypothetical protein [Falsiroseomonas frigidaquae]